MPSAFVPFLKSGGKAAHPSGGQPVSQTTDSAIGSGAFAALVPNGANPNPAQGNPTSGTAPHNHDGKPTISLQKDGDRVTHIRVKCACGEVVELECTY